jgi:hypothetical protein
MQLNKTGDEAGWDVAMQRNRLSAKEWQRNGSGVWAIPGKPGQALLWYRRLNDTSTFYKISIYSSKANQLRNSNSLCLGEVRKLLQELGEA